MGRVDQRGLLCGEVDVAVSSAAGRGAAVGGLGRPGRVSACHDRAQVWSSLRVTVDITPGRDTESVIDWLAARPQPWLDAITVATLDMAATYRSVYRQVLPQATPRGRSVPSGPASQHHPGHGPPLGAEHAAGPPWPLPGPALPGPPAAAQGSRERRCRRADQAARPGSESAPSSSLYRISRRPLRQVAR